MAFGIAAQLRPFALQRSHRYVSSPGTGLQVPVVTWTVFPCTGGPGDHRLRRGLEQRPAGRDRAEEARVRGRSAGRVCGVDGEPDRLADVPIAELVARGRGTAHGGALRAGGVAAVPLEAVRDVAEAGPRPERGR